MAGTWQGLVNQPPFHTSTMLLLSDGRVMVQEEATPHWHALTPDAGGSYVNGTWSTLADMSFWRRYYSSGILRDGRVIVVGGEQSGAGGDTNKGEIYDPVADSWTPISLSPWPQVGDAACCVLPDGRLMIGSLSTAECLIYDPATNSWTAAAKKAVRSNEETWILLPDETIVTVQCWEPYRSERYSTSSNAWKDEGKPPVMLVDPVMHEIGPAMLMYNGKVIWFGAANAHGRGKTAIYTPPPIYTGTGTWAVGPDIPPVGNRPVVCNDCTASLMPNGKVLFTAAPYQSNNWGSPIYFFEYDPFTNTIAQAPTPPNNAMQLYWSRMMLLPTGQVLFGPSTNNLQCYTPDGEPQEAWRPAIREVIPHCTRAGTDYYLLRGTQLNGLSQANTYGDNCYPATNYPLVRLRSMQTNQIYFCRAYDFSTMGVATGVDLESVRFDARHVPFGDFELCVIANGISSHCVSFCHRRSEQPCDCAGKHDHGCCCGSAANCCCEEATIDPQVAQLRTDMKTLQRSLQRIGTLSAGEPPERQPKEQRKVTQADRQATKEKPTRRRTRKS
jgi:Kelch motif protein